MSPGRKIGNQPLTADQKRLFVIALACLLAIVFAAAVTPAGHVVNDEGIYHLMAAGLANAGSQSLWNGYEEFRSAELVLPLMRAHEGRLVSQYPYLHPLLAYPFYILAGFRGLFLLNAIAYLASVAFCYAIARDLTRDRRLALNACLLFVFATFAWEYTQSALTQPLGALFVTASAYCAIAALAAANARRSLAWAGTAGLIAGLGTGVRLDVILALPALVVPFLFSRPWRPHQALAVGAGTVPGLIALAIANHVKFGTFNPFSYGPSATNPILRAETYLPVAVLGLAFIAAVWALSRPAGREIARKYRWAVAAGLVALCLGVLLTPVLWEALSRVAGGAVQFLVDSRLQKFALIPPENVRDPIGGIIVLGGLKKALLQACPYLVILVIPAALFLRGAIPRAESSVLFLVPLTFAGVYAYFGADGLHGLNNRYLLPIFPFTSILTAVAWRELTRDLDLEHRRWWLVAAGATAGLLVLLALSRPGLFGIASSVQQQGFFRLSLPLGLALLISALAIALVSAPRRGGKSLRGITTALTAAAFVWAAMTAFTYDFPRSYAMRKARADLAGDFAKVVAPDSIAFTVNPHLFFHLMADRRLRVALPWLDAFQDFASLATFHLEAGRGVYLWLSEDFEQELKDRKILDGFVATDLRDHRWGRLVRLSKPPRSAADRGDAG